MKTSNYILITFLVFLFGGILLLFVGAKNYEANEIASTLTQVKKIASFSVVVAEPGANLILKSGKEFSISQKYKKDIEPNFAPFEVRNDTLFMHAVNFKKNKLEEFIVPEVYCKNVKSILAKENSDVSLEDFYSDFIYIKMDKSRLKWKLGKVRTVSLDAKDSNINLSVEITEKLTVELDNTKFDTNYYQRINFLNGNLKNNSKATFTSSDNIHFKTDKTSEVHFVYWKY